MKKLLNWIKNNKFSSLLILVILVMLLFKNFTGGTNYLTGSRDTAEFAPVAMESAPGKFAEIDQNSRMVVTSSNFSLLVKNVTEAVDSFLLKAGELGGYMVSKDISMEEYAYSARISVRIPSDQVDDYTYFLRENSLKVVSEKIDGTDVTDQYTNVNDRINRLKETIVKLEEILDQAEDIEEILRIQQRIFSVQDQLDSYIGQKRYLKETVDTSLISIYLSTDELSLPFTPDEPWKPANVFKRAVRSMLETAQGLGSLVIWIAAYIPLILLTVGIFILIKKLIRKKRNQ